MRNPFVQQSLTGQRGVGKTVLLNAFEDAAQRQQWMVIRETARSGIVERLSRDHLPSLLEQLSVREGSPERQLKSAGVSVAGVGLNAAWEVPPAARHGLRKQLEALCAQLAQHETGLAITLDEVHDGNPDELGELGHVVQFLVRDDQPWPSPQLASRSIWTPSWTSAGRPSCVAPNGSV